MTWCWAPSGNSLTTIEMKVFCCWHKTDRTPSHRDDFCPANSHPKFVGKDPQIVLRNTWAEKLQFSSYRQLQSVLCEVPYTETKINPYKRLILQCFLFKNVLKIPTTLQNRNYYFIPFNKKNQNQTTQKHKNLKNDIIWLLI